MNNTKWNEIFRVFYIDVECSEDPTLSEMIIQWTTKSTDGNIYTDTTWAHFYSDSYEDIEWLKIDLTPENRKKVIDILHKIHVPGEITESKVIVYGYCTDVKYI